MDLLNFAKTLLLAALALACASPAGAAREAEVDAGAVLLAAHPEFQDPLWLQTVLLAAPLPHGGHVGLILNRPTAATLGKLFPDHAASQKIADAVYFGGPVSSETLVALVSAERSPGQGSLAIASGLFLALNGETIDRVIEQHPGAARYYVGVVLWRPGGAVARSQHCFKRNLGAHCRNRADAGQLQASAMKGILDAGFRYTPSHSTDIRKTFERILREREAREATARTPEEKGKNVLALNPRKAGSP